MTAPSEALQALHQQAQALLTQLHPLAVQAPGELQSTWAEHLDRLEQLVHFLAGGGRTPLTLPERAVSKAQWAEFGRLLRDKRTAAGLSRVQLARRAKLSDATIKFTETARHPPSRATLIRLIGVAELKLRWAEVPGRPTPPAPEPSGPPPRLEGVEMRDSLNCLLAPSYDPLSLMADLARFLQGAGGYLEQTSAYLDPGSAAAYLAFCQNSFLSTVLRSHLPLAEVAQQIVAASGRAPLQVLALGAGDGHSETQLVAHLMASGTSRAELCLLDISHPLLTYAYRHAVERLARQSPVHVWALQGNFHHLPLYAALHRPAASRQRRLITLLGGTLAHLDHEPRFLQQSLLDCQVDDLLLLDVPLANAPCTDRAEIK
ncbi:MAG TPA: L-histidine N(alpha)-methyltransferase, partial [Pseudomonadota bacterium]|nr:L-histidine N(alpha)-methyltransferase [Pseudomonadota bacterium]